MDNALVKPDKLDEKVSRSLTSYSSEQIAIIKSTVAKNTTPLELAFFLQIAQSVSLNPFNKEIWCYKDNKGNLIIFAGRDGHLVKAQQNPNFNGIRSSEIREKDEFSIDIANKKITHNVTAWGTERGKIKGAYAIVFRKDGEPTIEIADFERYNKGYSAWKTHPEAMIKKVAETNALKKSFGMASVQSEYDWEIRNGKAIPLQSPTVIPLLDDVKMLREDVESEVSNEEWLEKVCYSELGKSRAESKGEIEHMRKVFFKTDAYDLIEGEAKKDTNQIDMLENTGEENAEN